MHLFPSFSLLITLSCPPRSRTFLKVLDILMAFRRIRHGRQPMGERKVSGNLMDGVLSLIWPLLMWHVMLCSTFVFDVRLSHLPRPTAATTLMNVNHPNNRNPYKGAEGTYLRRKGLSKETRAVCPTSCHRWGLEGLFFLLFTCSTVLTVFLHYIGTT